MCGFPVSQHARSSFITNLHGILLDCLDWNSHAVITNNNVREAMRNLLVNNLCLQNPELIGLTVHVYNLIACSNGINSPTSAISKQVNM